MLHEYTVTYCLTDEQDARLKALTERFNRVMHTGNTPEALLDGLMKIGSVMLVNERMDDLSGDLVMAEAHMEGDCRECTV